MSLSIKLQDFNLMILTNIFNILELQGVSNSLSKKLKIIKDNFKSTFEQ